MKKLLLPLLFTALISASTLSIKDNIAPLNHPFFVKSTERLFDESISYTHKPLLACQPKLNVVYKTESTTKLKLIPNGSLPSGKSFSCSYQNETLTFKTEPLKVVDANYFHTNKILRLTFNDYIQIKSIKSALTLTKVDKLSKTTLNYTLISHDGKNMILKINEAVQNASIVLTLNKKLQTTQGTVLEKPYVKKFNTQLHNRVTLDKEKEALTIQEAPQMVALDTGGFALRIFLADTLEGNPNKSIEIEGIENFELSKNNYMNYTMRREYGMEDIYYYTDVISAEFKPNTSYKVTLKKGLKNYRELKQDKHYSLKTGDRAKAIIFNEDKQYISNKGELGFSSVNIDHATLIVERLLDDNLRYFMNFENADTTSTQPYSKEILTKEITLSNQKNLLLKQKILLKDLHHTLNYGVYKLTLRYTKPSPDEGEEDQEEARSKIIFVSDLGISVNLAKNQAFVSVLSLSTANPIADASVELYAKNNALIATATTNKDGIAIIDKTKLLTLNPKGIVVKTSHDKNFLALNKTIGSPTPEAVKASKERFKAFVYFQSNILRPASRVNALVTIKDRDFISATKLPVKVIFKEEYGKVLQEKVYHTDEFGLIEFNYQMDIVDKTGNYVLNIYIGDTFIGSKRVKVEAFMPPKIENTLSTNKNTYLKDELIDLNISSSYLFGAPSSQLNGTVTLNARAVDFNHKAYQGYRFSNHLLEEKNVESYIDYREEFTLDSQGKYHLILPTKVNQTTPSILSAMIGVTVMDDAQPVSNYKKVTIYPYKEMVGLKLDNYSFEKGEKLTGKAVLIDPVSMKKIDRELYAVVKRISWQYDYSEGDYNWQKETLVVDSFSLKSNESFSRNIHRNGDYVIEIYDRLGGHSASSEFDVWWWSYSNISPKNDLKSVEIKFEDKLYKKGDELAVTLKSPILEGKVLLTLESNKVESYKRVEMHKGVAKVTLPISFEMKRGIHLHATAIRPSDTSSELIPFRAMGYKFVKPNRNAHKINVQVRMPKVTKSKTSLPLTITTDKPAKVLISIVDRGILQLVNQKKPELFNYFNEPAEKEMSYYDLYDQLMSYVAEGKRIDFGAGDMMAKKKKHLAPDLGERIKPFMLWSGIIDLSSKKKTIHIDIPEFNGRVAVVAIAVNKESVSASEEDMSIRDNIMIKPSYPKYTLLGDELSVPIRLFNTTNKSKTLNLTHTSSTNLKLSVKQEPIVIAANSSALLNATLTTKEIGKGEITLYATDGKEKVSKSVELPIYNPYTISTKTFKGISNQNKTFTVPNEYQDAKVYISLSNNLIGALRDDLKYLVQYPYGCAEQTSSKLSAMHYAKAFLAKDHLVGESQNFIRQGVKKLHNMQNYYGEFNYWRGGDHVHAYASLYAAQTLLELERDGTEIAPSFIKKIITMLKSVAKNDGSYEASYSNFHRLYAAFILAEHNELSNATANMLYEKKIYKDHFLATFYMSAILKIKGKTKDAKTLYNSSTYKLSRYAHKTYGNRTGNFESNVRDMFLHFIIKSQYFNKENSDLVAIQKEFSNLYSTQSKAIALKAISLYLGKPKNSNVDVDVTINNEHANYSEPMTVAIDKVSSKEISLSPNAGAMSYSVELVKHLPKAIKNSIDHDEPLSIMREFIDDKGNNVNLNHLVQGDKVYAKVTISNIGEIKNVVVNQRIPACLTIVNNNIKGQKEKYPNKNIHLEYRDIRDDRVLHFINLKNKTKYDKNLKKYLSVQQEGILYTPLMVSTLGSCKLPAIITEAMYDSRINSYAKEAKKVMVFKKESNVSTVNTITNTSSHHSFKEQAQSLVKELYTKEMTSNDPQEFVKYFHYPLEVYYRSRNVTKEKIIKDKKNYFQDWSKRNYTNIKTEIVKEASAEVKVKITFNYLLDNGKKTLKGESKHFLTVKKIDHKLFISKIELK